MTISRLIFIFFLMVVAMIVAFLIVEYAIEQTDKRNTDIGLATATREAEVNEATRASNRVLKSLTQLIAINAVNEGDENTALRYAIIAGGLGEYIKKHKGDDLSQEVQHALLQVLGNSTQVDSNKTSNSSVIAPVVSDDGRWMVNFSSSQ